MAYQSSYAGAMAAQNKKKKPPSRGANTPPAMPPPQTYGGNKAVNMAPGVGGNEADPLVTAIAEGATGGGLGANNQDGDRAIGTGRPTGSDVFQQNINPQAGQGANAPPPPPPSPPPPPVQQNMPGTVQGGNTQVQQNMAGTVQGTPPVQQNMPGAVQGVPVQQNIPGSVQGTPPVQENMAGTVQGGNTQVQQNMPNTVQGGTSANNSAANMPPGVGGNVTTALPPNTPANMDPNAGVTSTGGTGYTEDTAKSAFGGVTADDNLTNKLRDDINKQYQDAFGGTTTQAEDINKQYQDAFGGTTTQADDINKQYEDAFGGTTTRAEDINKQYTEGMLPATTQAEDINRQYTEGMLPATTQREDINKQYEEAFGGTTTQADDINRQYEKAFGGAPVQTTDQRDDINRQYEEAFGGAPVQTTPTDIAGAGADMAAAQNVVTPEAEPMPGTLEDALRQQYMSRVGGTDDPILASQLADQQMRQNEQRKALVEQLGRYGVLRGGGDTAAALARMGEGDERNRLALEAQAAQRRQQDLRDAQGFDLGQRGMGLQEDRFGQDRLTQELAREVTEAGQTGQFRGGQTMAGQRQEADIFGEVDGRQTLQSDIQRGQLGLGERQTGLQERTGAEDIRRSTAQRGAIEGQEGRADQQLESQLFGEVDGRQTLTGETTESNIKSQDLERRRAEAGLTGTFDYGDQRGTTQTQAAKALASELETAALGRDVSRAGQTGEFEGEDTIEKRLQEAQLTGDYLDEEGRFLGRTLAGQEGEMDRVGAILAAADAGIIDNRVAEEELRRVLALSSGGVGAYGDGGGGGGGADLSNEERRNREQQFQDALNRSTNQEEEFGDYNPEGEVIDVGPDGELPEGFTENQDGTFSSMINGIPQTFIYRKGPQGENVLVNITDPDFRR